MVKIKLVDTGWSMIPEGDYTFKITDSNYDEDFGKVEINMVAQSGQTHNERFQLITKSGSMNEGALKAFSYFAKTALNNMRLDEIDPSDLKGCYVSATVEHVESDAISEKTGKPFINVRLQNLKPSVGFSETAAKNEPEDDPFVEESNDDDLDDWLA
ncbi:hypothetical protein LGW19_10025 [Streptococcus mutans]|nr:hypothetical protein [Streptococcus mutans]MCB5030069.1 hypothetical protein [Streptococcus mutans]